MFLGSRERNNILPKNFDDASHRICELNIQDGDNQQNAKCRDLAIFNKYQTLSDDCGWTCIHKFIYVWYWRNKHSSTSRDSQTMNEIDRRSDKTRGLLILKNLRTFSSISQNFWLMYVTLIFLLILLLITIIAICSIVWCRTHRPLRWLLSEILFIVLHFSARTHAIVWCSTVIQHVFRCHSQQQHRLVKLMSFAFFMPLSFNTEPSRHFTQTQGNAARWCRWSRISVP